MAGAACMGKVVVNLFCSGLLYVILSGTNGFSLLLNLVLLSLGSLLLLIIGIYIYTGMCVCVHLRE